MPENQIEIKELQVYELPRIIRVQTRKDIEEGRLETVEVEMFFQDVLVPVERGLSGNAISKGAWQSITLQPTEALLLHMHGLAEEGYRQILERKAQNTPQPEPSPPPEENL